MEDKKNFGEYLRQKRKEIGLTQNDFAQKLFVTESAVSKWERGVSYPDISLVKDICEILHITEHELLTASEDVQTRTNEKLAQRYVALIKKYRLINYIIYGITLITCFICNLAIEHRLSWFFIVLMSVAVVASITLLSTFFDKYKGIATLASFTVSLLLLLLVCNMYSGGSWFLIAALSVVLGLAVLFLPFVISNSCLPEKLSTHKAALCLGIDTILLFLLIIIVKLLSQEGWSLYTGLLITAFWLIIPWGILFVVRYTKMNRFLKVAICIGICDVIFFLSQGFMTMVIDKRIIDLGYNLNLAIWDMQTINANIRILTFIILTIIALIFVIIGMKNQKQNK